MGNDITSIIVIYLVGVAIFFAIAHSIIKYAVLSALDQFEKEKKERFKKEKKLLDKYLSEGTITSEQHNERMLQLPTNIVYDK